MPYCVFVSGTGVFQIHHHHGHAFECRAVAGHGVGRNNPRQEGVRNVGPLPRGEYSLREEPRKRFAAPAFRLVAGGQPMYGRSGFWIHGGTHSEGCILLPLHVRRLLVGVPTLYVVHWIRDAEGVDLNLDATTQRGPIQVRLPEGQGLTVVPPDLVLTPDVVVQPSVSPVVAPGGVGVLVPTNPTPTPEDTLERKVRIRRGPVVMAVRAVAGEVTEFLDALNAFYYAIPFHLRPGVYALHRRDGSVYYVQRWKPSVAQRVAAVREHFSELDLNALFRNVLRNQVTDMAVGRASGHIAQAYGRTPIGRLRGIGVQVGPWDTIDIGRNITSGQHRTHRELFHELGTLFG